MRTELSKDMEFLAGSPPPKCYFGTAQLESLDMEFTVSEMAFLSLK